MMQVRLNICCPRDCVSRRNGGTAGAPLKPLRVDSALRAPVGINGLRLVRACIEMPCIPAFYMRLVIVIGIELVSFSLICFGPKLF